MLAYRVIVNGLVGGLLGFVVSRTGLPISTCLLISITGITVWAAFMERAFPDKK